jgi:hypothetical protein
MMVTGEGGLPVGFVAAFSFFSSFVFCFGVLFSSQVCAFFLKC